MSQGFKLTGYFAGALFSGQELYANRIMAAEIDRVSRGIVQMDVPQDMSTQEVGDDKATRSADYLGMLQRDFCFANMNGPDLDSGTVAEYMVASMLGMPRVQFRTDFRNVGDVRSEFPGLITVCKTASVPYNLMLCHDESALVYANSMALYKNTPGLAEFLEKLAVAAVRGIQLAFDRTETAKPQEYSSQFMPLTRYLRLDPEKVAGILKHKQERHSGNAYREAIRKLTTLDLGGH